MFGKRSDQPRTAEDRARAAAERAARRAGRPLPAEAFEHAVRPPDVDPHEPFFEGEEEPPRRVEEPAAPHEAAALPPAPREEFAPSSRATREDAVPPAAARGDVAPAPAASHDEAAPGAAAPRREATPRAAREEAAPPAAAHGDEVAPGTTAQRHEAAPPPAVPRAEAAPPAAARDDAPAADAVGAEAASGSAARNGRARSEDLTHQPTAEYTPFQTDEHAVPREPLGEPAEDESRLVAARGTSRANAAAARRETAEHMLEADEHPEPLESRRAAPLRRAPVSPKNSARRRAPNAPRGRSRRPKPPKSSRPTGEGHWGRRILAVIGLIVILAALYVVNATFQPFHGDGEGRVAVTIPENSDAGEIGRLLADKGVVDSARFFELSATLGGDRGSLRPGRYELKQGMKNAAVIDALTTVPEAPKAVETVSVTLVEGPSRKENAPVVNDSGKVEGDYARASSSKATLRRIRGLGAPKGTKTAEGFLFPATYELEVGSSANQLVKHQLDAFEENFDKVDMSRAKRKNLTRYDVLIIASLIEREASVARERRLVSAVIYNRLKEGMPLGIDATTRYSTNNWQRPIRQSELDRDEPYNTRLNRGLPPTPIGNPGLASLKAAANPADRSYLFYVRKPGKSGEHAFSSTDAEFQRDVAKYQASREGG